MRFTREPATGARPRSPAFTLVAQRPEPVAERIRVVRGVLDERANRRADRETPAGRRHGQPAM